MNKDRYPFRIFIALITCLFILNRNFTITYALDSLTKEERAYIEESKIIKAGSMNGVAPIAYRDETGEIKGIGKYILDEISKMTGLTFEYELYNSREEFLNSSADIFFGISKTFGSQNINLSKPFLKSETILFTNSKIDSNKLDNKTYAVTIGDKIPPGVNKNNIKYYDTREETLDAVESGEADYGYGNSYSVAFYNLQNGYKNIITIPKGHSIREYCIGVVEDDVLLSIINKSLDTLGENQIQNIILNVASQVDRKITSKMIMDTYGAEIILLFTIIIIILTALLIRNHKIRKELKLLCQIDRLTGLYNDMTSRNLIISNLNSKDRQRKDTFIIMDCDQFKAINDNYGHLTGDQVLINVGRALKLIFDDENSIIGRIGGDEFCVYIRNVDSKDYVDNKCRSFNPTLQRINKELKVSLSMGVVIFKGNPQYKKLFKKADDALYEAKSMGSSNWVIKTYNLYSKES